MPMSVALVRLCLIVGLAVCISGCGGVKPRNLPKSPVTGEVKLEGKHLPDGQIIFLHLSGEMATANLKEDGKYQLDVAQGKNDVLVRSVEITGGKADGPSKAASMEIQRSRIPDRYSMPGKSGLELDVKAGKNEFNVELKAK